MQDNVREKIAVYYAGQGDFEAYQQLAERLTILLLDANAILTTQELPPYLLTWHQDCLMLLEASNLKQSGQFVEIEHRPGEQLSWPIAKQGAFAQALGKKTKTIVDATAGWGQDALSMFRMGYQVTCLESSPVLAELLRDGFDRLARLDWVQRLELSIPELQSGNAINLLHELSFVPDCVYLDPMFPPKRKKSALAKKSMMLLRDLVGDDDDKAMLFSTALAVAGKRVVVKSPDYAEPLGGKPDASFHGKLLRYDVYLKN